MNYETFMQEKERISKLPDEEQKRFYEKVLEEEKEESVYKRQSVYTKKSRMQGGKISACGTFLSAQIFQLS